MSKRLTLALVVATMLIASVSRIGFSQQASRPLTPLPSSKGIEGAMVKVIHEIEVAAQADGLIDELLVDEGQVVGRDAILIKIDSRVAEAEVAVAKKELETATKQAEQTADIEYAQISYKVSEAEYEDAKKLYYEKFAASLTELRRAQLENEKGRLGVEVAVVKQEQESLARDVAAEKLHAAEVRLGLFQVRAPMDGMIVERLRDRGEWVRAGDPVFKLVHMDEVKIEATVDVSEISPAELLDAPVKIRIPVNRDYTAEFDAKIEFVSPFIDAGQVAVWAKVPNQRLPGTNTWIFRDGMHVEMELAK